MILRFLLYFGTNETVNIYMSDQLFHPKLLHISKNISRSNITIVITKQYIICT